MNYTSELVAHFTPKQYESIVSNGYLQSKAKTTLEDYENDILLMVDDFTPEDQDVKIYRSVIVTIRKALGMHPPLRLAKIHYQAEDGKKSSYFTNLAAHLKDQDIFDYFKVGSFINIGRVADRMAEIQKVEIYY